MLLLSADDVQAVLEPAAVLAAVEEALRCEARGQARLMPRWTTDLEHGWFRVMPGALLDGGRGVFGGKLMNLTRGRGLYYMVVLYDEPSGELLALMDASAITQLRTGAVSALFARLALPGGAPAAGVFGSGFEARGQLEMVAHAVRLGGVRVYSPNPEHRRAFAGDMSARLGLPVEAVDEPRQAAEGLPLVILATKAAQPVLDGRWLAPGAVVLSIGSTRRDLREVDLETLARAGRVFVDQTEQALAESADIRAGIEVGVISRESLVELHRVVAGEVELRAAREAPLLFKPSGTALQDLAVARLVHERCLAAGRGRRVEGLLTRKPTV